MSMILGFTAAALLLVFFEVLLPGGVLGVLSALCLLAASWIGYDTYGLIGGNGNTMGRRWVRVPLSACTG